ncbi:MAG: UDP-2,3-diacylglucosamine diphosphatase [Bacteroidales bacterium]|jgi:UDP-2,3-diacylglucosamine pyrophosphatase LpxH
MKHKKRRVKIVVVSDVHLGTYGSHAKELLNYLRSIKTKTLILNGDIIDMWQFKKRYWPKSHMKLVKFIIGLTAKGTEVYYITGNHDEMLRKFDGVQMGNLKIVNKLELDLDGKKAWIFHGDVFDVIMQHSRWLMKLGSIGYDLLIHLNTFVNYYSKLLGRGKVSLSKKIKDNVKSAVKYINNFELTSTNLAIAKGFDYIVCGHIHQPVIRNITDQKGKSILYLNSGDWIENLSALEYHKGKWSIYHYQKDQVLVPGDHEQDDLFSSESELNNKELFLKMVKEFQD